MPVYPNNSALPVVMAPKDPDAKLDYVVDWASWLGADTIATVAWTVESGVTNEATSNDTTKATIWLSGGTPGTTYTIQCRITTAAGRIDERSFKVPVAQR